ncbi:uncharacterized protein LOC130893114 isoform X1 [Diorhabda carinulata]|uniref:uncharacterized protein LOC130893114 isoform X1 n=1 Tax=Diorhabda carinulata TaxID=1163345 RepID=UPI0025A10F7A|nr:uncharacterized protein LOC130893114 isoform X1 [Diorhabda carinulata]
MENSIKECSNEQNPTNIDVTDLDEETVKKLRGDAIGDTLYSQSFVLKTLLKFSDLQWNDQVEEDLCFLWDMTVEKDVCEFLLNMSFPSVACSAMLQYDDNNRFLEIVLGILANIFCSGCVNVMSKNELDIILCLINSDDPLILIQLMRFISTSAITSKVLFELVDNRFLQQISFILKSSINKELLLKTLETLAKLTTGHKINDQLINYKIYESIIIGFKTIMNDYDFGSETQEKSLSIKYMLENVTNICSFINKYNKRELLINIQSESNAFIDEVTKIFNFYSHKENLLPVSDYFIFYMSAITYIFTNIELKYCPELFLAVTKILEHIIDIRDEVEELFNSTLELEYYLISISNQKNIEKDLKVLPKPKLKKVLNVINENYSRFHFGNCINISSL